MFVVESICIDRRWVRVCGLRVRRILAYRCAGARLLRLNLAKLAEKIFAFDG